MTQHNEKNVNKSHSSNQSESNNKLNPNSKLISQSTHLSPIQYIQVYIDQILNKQLTILNKNISKPSELYQLQKIISFNSNAKQVTQKQKNPRKSSNQPINFRIYPLLKKIQQKYFIEVENQILKTGKFQKMPTFTKQIIILNITPSKNYQIIKLQIHLHYYKTELILLNQLTNNQLLHNCKSHLSGSFGEVYFVQFMEQVYSIKILPYSKPSKESSNQIIVEDVVQSLITIIKEYFFILLFSQLKIGPQSKNIAGFDLIVSQNCVMFATQVCLPLEQNEKNQIELKINLLKMHSLKIVHRDIKPANFMHSRTFKRPVFIDFGLTKVLNQCFCEKSMSKFVGTTTYCSQQMLNILFLKQQCLDLYWNDLCGINKSFSNPLGFQHNIDDIELVEVSLFNIYNIKYNLYVQNYVEFERNWEYISKKYIIFEQIEEQILRFFYQLEPNKYLQRFYRSQISQDKKLQVQYIQLKKIYENQHNFVLWYLSENKYKKQRYSQIQIIYQTLYILNSELNNQQQQIQLLLLRKQIIQEYIVLIRKKVDLFQSSSYLTISNIGFDMIKLFIICVYYISLTDNKYNLSIQEKAHICKQILFIIQRSFQQQLIKNVQLGFICQLQQLKQINVFYHLFMYRIWDKIPQRYRLNTMIITVSNLCLFGYPFKEQNAQQYLIYQFLKNNKQQSNKQQQGSKKQQGCKQQQGNKQQKYIYKQQQGNQQQSHQSTNNKYSLQSNKYSYSLCNKYSLYNKQSLYHKYSQSIKSTIFDDKCAMTQYSRCKISNQYQLSYTWNKIILYWWYKVILITYKQLYNNHTQFIINLQEYQIRDINRVLNRVMRIKYVSQVNIQSKQQIGVDRQQINVYINRLIQLNNKLYEICYDYVNDNRLYTKLQYDSLISIIRQSQSIINQLKQLFILLQTNYYVHQKAIQLKQQQIKQLKQQQQQTKKIKYDKDDDVNKQQLRVVYKQLIDYIYEWMSIIILLKNYIRYKLKILPSSQQYKFQQLDNKKNNNRNKNQNTNRNQNQNNNLNKKQNKNNNINRNQKNNKNTNNKLNRIKQIINLFNRNNNRNNKFIINNYYYYNQIISSIHLYYYFQSQSNTNYISYKIIINHIDYIINLKSLSLKLFIYQRLIHYLSQSNLSTLQSTINIFIQQQSYLIISINNIQYISKILSIIFQYLLINRDQFSSSTQYYYLSIKPQYQLYKIILSLCLKDHQKQKCIQQNQMPTRIQPIGRSISHMKQMNIQQTVFYLFQKKILYFNLLSLSSFYFQKEKPIQTLLNSLKLQTLSNSQQEQYKKLTQQQKQFLTYISQLINTKYFIPNWINEIYSQQYLSSQLKNDKNLAVSFIKIFISNSRNQIQTKYIQNLIQKYLDPIKSQYFIIQHQNHQEMIKIATEYFYFKIIQTNYDHYWCQQIISFFRIVNQQNHTDLIFSRTTILKIIFNAFIYNQKSYQQMQAFLFSVLNILKNSPSQQKINIIQDGIPTIFWCKCPQHFPKQTSTWSPIQFTNYLSSNINYNNCINNPLHSILYFYGMYDKTLQKQFTCRFLKYILKSVEYLIIPIRNILKEKIFFFVYRGFYSTIQGLQFLSKLHQKGFPRLRHDNMKYEKYPDQIRKALYYYYKLLRYSDNSKDSIDEMIQKYLIKQYIIKGYSYRRQMKQLYIKKLGRYFEVKKNYKLNQRQIFHISSLQSN